MAKLSSKLMNLCFELYSKQPWLAASERPQALYELIEMCSDIEHQALLVELLHRFTHVDSMKCAELLGRVADKICLEWRLLSSNTQIVGTSFANEADSSQQIVQTFKPCLTQRNWSRVRTHPILNLRKIADDTKLYPNVVMMDEFAGTGRTIVHRVRELARDLSQRQVDGVNIYVCLIACMEDAKERIEGAGINLYTPLVLKKGISGHESPEVRGEKLQAMLAIEALLLAENEGLVMPSLGYEASESLYAMEHGNTPNNVFPIFWWQWLADGTRRSVLLHRAEAL